MNGDCINGERESSPRLATRLERLGTETAYAISDEARALSSTGKKIYAFHIGDENFHTAPSVVESCKREIDEGRTNYPPAAGVEAVRACIARHVSEERGLRGERSYGPENVLVQPGGKPVILKFLLATMNEGDRVAYPSPGYPIYESLVRFLGGIPRPYGYTVAKDGTLRLDVPSLRTAVEGNGSNHGPARRIIWNDLHNPTGYCATPSEHDLVADLAVKNDAWVLSDEAYFHVVYDPADAGHSVVDRPGMKGRTVVLITSSKTWAMTGWRLGAAVGPEAVISIMSKIAVNDEGCTNHFVQRASMAAFGDASDEDDGGGAAAAARHARTILDELRVRRDRMVELLGDVPGFDVPGGKPPRSTFYLWTDVTEAFGILGLPTGDGDDGGGRDDPASVAEDYETFRKLVLDATGVSFCTRVHFGDVLPGERGRYVRFAYSGIDVEDIEEGMGKLRSFMDAKVAEAKARDDRRRRANGNSGRNARPRVELATSTHPKFPRRLEKELGRRPRVFCTRQLPRDAYDLLDGIAELEVWPGYDPPPRKVLLEKARSCDGLVTLLTDAVDEELLSACPRLQVVSQCAVGYNNVDVEACTRRGVRVSNTPGVLTDTVVETALALLLACGRRVIEADRYVRAGGWTTAWHPLMLLGQDVHGSTVGIVGAGRIGDKFARVVKALGADVVYFDPRRNAKLEEDGIAIRASSLDDLCSRSDFVSIHVNLTSETTRLFDDRRFGKCKPNCVLINTSRGAVVDQEALVRALRDGRIRAAGLDVLEDEPIRTDDPLLAFEDRVVLLPHLGSASEGTRSDMSRLVGENMRAYWTGGAMGQLVNPSVES